MKKTGVLMGSLGRKLFILLVLVLAAGFLAAQSSRADELKIMSFNITKVGTYVDDPATRILQGLEPDVVLLQEWILDASGPWGEDYRAWVDDAFGSEFSYYRGLGPGGAFCNVNGIVSRWSLQTYGSWDDVEVSNRYFDWAVIDIPGDIHLQVVSIHLKADPDPTPMAIRVKEAENLKTLIEANFDVNHYICVGGDLNTVTRTSEPDLISVFDSYLTTTDGIPEDRDHNDDTNLLRTKNYDWIIPNEKLGDEITTLYLGSSSYNEGIVFDSRVFTPLSEVTPIQAGDTPSGDMDHCPVMKAYDIIPDLDQVFLMKADGGYDYNLYLYRSIIPGDTTYWDSKARNPSPLARDLWVIPSGNNAVGMTFLAMQDETGESLNALAVMKNEGGDYNLYIYRSILPGDWTYWDAKARNPSPIARDLWIIPSGNNTAITARTDGDADGLDELLLLKNIGGSQKLFIYNAPKVGDWTYWDAFLRNWNATNQAFYLAKDEWFIPRSSNIAAMAGMRVIKSGDSWTEGIVTIENSWGDQNLYVWKVPQGGDNTYMNNQVRQLGYNPSTGWQEFGYPQCQDLWIVPDRNDIQAITGIASVTAGDPLNNPAGDYDVICSLGNKGGDNNFWVWKTVQSGDITYPQALLRQDGYPRATPEIPNFGKPQARDLWVMPAGNNVTYIAAIPAPPPPPTPTPDIIYAWFEAEGAGDPEDPYRVDFTDASWSSETIVTYEWDFTYNGVTFNVESTEKNPSYSYPDDSDFTAAHQVTDTRPRTAFVARSYTWGD